MSRPVPLNWLKTRAPRLTRPSLKWTVHTSAVRAERSMSYRRSGSTRFFLVLVVMGSVGGGLSYEPELVEVSDQQAGPRLEIPPASETGVQFLWSHQGTF